MNNQKGQSGLTNAETTNSNSKPRKKKVLRKGEDQNLQIKILMDAVLELSTDLPDEVKKAVVAARDAAWDAFKAEQEAQMKLYG